MFVFLDLFAMRFGRREIERFQFSVKQILLLHPVAKGKRFLSCARQLSTGTMPQSAFHWKCRRTGFIVPEAYQGQRRQAYLPEEQNGWRAQIRCALAEEPHE